MNYTQKYHKYKRKYSIVKNSEFTSNPNSNSGKKSNFTTFYNNDLSLFSQVGSSSMIGNNNDDDITDYNNNITDSNNSFTIQLFKNLDTAGNIFSPIGIIYLLSLIHLATVGNTDYQLKSLIGHNYTPDELSNIGKLLQQSISTSIIKMSTMLIINDKYKINRIYETMIENLSIIIYEKFDKSELVVNKINEYILHQTDARIKNLLNDIDIDKNCAIVMISTVYFKADWSNGFGVTNTRKMSFHDSPTNMVDMMYQTNDFRYYENKKVQGLEMLCNNGEYVMGFILPKRYLEEDELEYNTNNVPIISDSIINEMINNMEMTRVEIYIPKFTQKKNIELIPILKKMGITELFGSQDREIDILKQLSIPNSQIISSIVHEAVVEIDESGDNKLDKIAITGFKSAGSTSILGSKLVPPQSDSIFSSTHKKFKADHIFIYYVRHIISGLILFYGDYQGS